MKSFLKYLAVLLSGFLILIIGLIVTIAVLTEQEPVVEDNSYLYIPISGDLPEYVPPEPLEDYFGGAPLDLKKIRDDLEKAAIDDRINGVILNLGFLQTGYAKIHELQNLISNFRKSGKKIYAYMEFAFTKEYLVATACDSIIMPINANLFLTGVGSELTFYKDLFSKVGIEADFVHVGAYKSYPEQFTRNNSSDKNLTVMNDILDQIYSTIIDIVAEKRDLPVKKVKDLINNQGGFTGREAKEYGLIDANLFMDDVIELLRKDTSKPKKLSANTYAMIPASSLGIRNKSKIAVINITGTIASGSDTDDPILGKIAGSSTIVNSIDEAASSSSTKAIILRIDSPGGSAVAANTIWDAVMRAREKKPVIASISDYGASGGYYIAMGADTIINDPISLVGSIGVFAGKFALKGLYDKIGINHQSILRGKNAGIFSTTTPWTTSERAIIQRLINDFYVDFVSKVARNRGLEYASTDSIAQGRVWSGEQAQSFHLADTTGTFYDALKIAQIASKIDENESVRLTYYPKERSLINEIYSMVFMKVTAFDAIIQIENSLMIIENKPLALLPFKVEWK